MQVRLVPQEDGTVKLAVQPAIFYFGNVVLPDQPSASASAPADVASSPDRADDPSNKDQTKDTRRADSTTRKSAGFPGIFKRLFSGLRGSNGGSSSAAAAPEPVTAQQLGLKLLANAEPPAITAGRDAVMAAGFVQAAPAENAGSPGAAAASSSPARGTRYPEDAAAAAHHLSADIFRNVINAAAMVSPKASPRDTAFPTRTPGTLQQRDQQEQPAAAGTAAAEREGSQPATPSRGTSNDGASSQAGSPDDKHAGLVALLTGCIAEDPVAESAAAAAPVAAAAITADEQEAGQLQPAGASQEVSEGGGLPMPLLEKCESPVVDTRAGGFADEVQPVASSGAEEAAGAASASAAEPATEQSAPEPAAVTAAATAAAAPAAAVSPAAASVAAAEAATANTASPRTVGRRAYGTVANVVKKLIPSFRDSATTASVSASANGAPTSPAAAGSVTAPAQESAASASSGSAAAAAATRAEAAAAAIPADPVAAEQVDVQVGKEVAAAAAAVAAAATAAPAAVAAAAADPAKATEAAAKVIDAASAAAVKQVQEVEQQGGQAAKALAAEAAMARSPLPPRGPSAPTAALADGEAAASDGLESSAAAGARVDSA